MWVIWLKALKSRFQSSPTEHNAVYTFRIFIIDRGLWVKASSFDDHSISYIIPLWVCSLFDESVAIEVPMELAGK